MAGDAALSANSAAREAVTNRAAEDALLEQVLPHTLLLSSLRHAHDCKFDCSHVQLAFAAF